MKNNTTPRFYVANKFDNQIWYYSGRVCNGRADFLRKIDMTNDKNKAVALSLEAAQELQDAINRGRKRCLAAVVPAPSAPAKRQTRGAVDSCLSAWAKL